MVELRIQEDGSEIVPYPSAAFPLHLSVCMLSMYPGMCCVSHWHDEYEFIVVRRGRLLYRVNGMPVPLAAGEGLYVGPRAVHGIEPVDGEDCEYLCVVFSAALLSAAPQIHQTVQAHLAPHEAAHYLRLLPQVAPHGEILRELSQLPRIAQQRAPGWMLACLGTLYRVIAHLGSAAPGGTEPPKPDRNLAQVKDMMRLIRTGLTRKLTLAEIARAGRLSRSACESAFERVLHTSPIRYLTNCRLDLGMELLQSTPMTVTEIAQRAGFCSGSYFAEQFKKRMGCSPAAYRKTHRHTAALPADTGETRPGAGA